MRKRVKVTLAGLMAAVVGALGWQLLEPREPVYQGLSLTAWLRQSAGMDEPSSGDTGPSQIAAEAARLFETGRQAELDRVHAKEVIRSIGTNALPELLKMAASSDSTPMRLFLGHVPEELFVRLGLWNWYRSYAGKSERYRELAEEGFRVLGPDALPAVPAIAKLLADPDWSVRTTAAEILYQVGPTAQDAVPALIKCLNDPSEGVRVQAAGALSNIPWRPDLMVPGLVQNLQRPVNLEVLWMTLERLGGCGEAAKAAVPTIVPFLTHTELKVRKAATNALSKISGQTEANVKAE